LFLLNRTGRLNVLALLLCNMSTEGTMAHQYQVLEELGAGSFGVVSDRPPFSLVANANWTL
jgi:hypothetical protein